MTDYELLPQFDHTGSTNVETAEIDGETFYSYVLDVDGDEYSVYVSKDDIERHKDE